MERLRELSEHYSAPLTILSIGYSEQNLVGDKILPVIPFNALSVKAPVYGRDSFRVAGAERELYGVPATVSTTRTWQEFTLSEISLGAMIDVKERIALQSAETVWDLEAASAFVAKSNVQNACEKKIADFLTDTSNYDASAVIPVASGSEWDKKSGGVSVVNPFDDIEAERRAFRKRIGRFPNVAWMGMDVWHAIADNTKVRDMFFGDGKPGVITVEMVRERLQLEKLIVGENVVLSGDPGSEVLTDVWGEYFGLLYIAPETNKPVPTWGFIAQASWSNPGGLRSMGIVTRWDVNPYVRRVDYSTWLKPHVAMKEAGSLFTNCLT